MKHLRRGWMILFLLLAASVWAYPAKAEAASCVIEFSAAETEIKRGDIFTVVCQVSSSEPFVDTTFTIEYDDSIMQFIKGGKKVSGGYGELLVNSFGNSTETYEKTFSLQFMGKGSGSGLVYVKGTADVTDAEGSNFSVSSNRLSIHVSKKGQKPEADRQQPDRAVVTPAPVKSGKNRLEKMTTTAVSMTPEFSPDVMEYSAVVDCDTDTLYFTMQPEDELARIKVSGNEKLKEGMNQVSIRVTAENGKERIYRIAVNRETADETKERTGGTEEEKKEDILFGVITQGDTIFLKNSYEFEVMDVSGLTTVPEGYVQTSVTLEGVSLPAFTAEDALDGNYLLFYLKGPSGTSSLYQYDREEKTLQRYTGNMVERINSGRKSSGSFSFGSTQSYVMLGIIVVLVVVILCLLITMLKMAMKKKEPHNDTLDF